LGRSDERYRELPVCGVLGDNNTGTAVGANGTIVRTTDGGTTWALQSSGTSNHLYAVSFADASVGSAVGVGTVFRTTNGGATWVRQPSGVPSSVYLKGVSFIDSNTGTAVGGSDILHTANSGTTWVSQPSGTTNSLYGVSLTDANSWIAVGASGTILRTANGGATWVSQASGTTKYLQGVFFRVQASVSPLEVPARFFEPRTGARRG
jgi:photosystem II stability/assembly factor-like uncharacterized protein